MSISIGFVLDAAIIVLLAITIFYAFRLSVFLKTFRDGREEIQRLFIDLTNHIDRAEKSMQTMREAADQSGTNLQKIVSDAKALSDELRFMNEAGDSLAGRLEKLASRNKELIDLLEKSGGIGPADIPRNAPPRPAPKVAVSSPPTPTSQKPLPDFLINDRDFFEKEEAEEYFDDLQMLEDDYDWENEGVAEEQGLSYDEYAEEEMPGFASEAEREFYLSMKQAQRKKTSGVA